MIYVLLMTTCNFLISGKDIYSCDRRKVMQIYDDIIAT